MSRVMVFGTFDHFHLGHLDYFRQARRYGEELVIVVARDQNVQRFKGRRPQEDEKTRVKRVRQALREEGYSGRAVLGGMKNIWLVLNKYKPEVIALGYDQEVDLDKLKSEVARFRFFCRIKRLRPYHPEKYKSSLYQSNY
jgi:FAD synthetase